MPFVQQKAEQSTSSVSSFTTTAMTVTGGNAIVACMGANGGILTSLNASDSKANPYTNGVSTLFNANGNVAIGVARAIASGSTTFTVTPNAARFVSISAQEYSNLGASNEATNGSSATASTAVNPGAVNPASANDLYVSCWTHDGSVNQTFTFNVSGEGWNPRADLENTTNQPLGSQDLISSGSRTGSATLSASARWEAAVATFQTVAAAAAVVPLTQPLLMTLGQRGKSAKPWAWQSFRPSPPPYEPPVPPSIAPLLVRFAPLLGRQQMGRLTTQTPGVSGPNNFSQALTATLDFVGALVKSTAHTGEAGALSFAGALVKRTSTARTATLSFAGSLARTTGKVLTGALSFAGARAVRIAKGLAGTLSFAGSVTRAITLAAKTATLNFAGALVKSTATARTATLSFSGSVLTGKAFLRAFTATLSFSGAFAKLPNKALAGALSFAGSQSRAIVHTMSAALSFAGSQTRRITLAAKTATLSFAGSLVAGHLFTKALTATLSFAGAASRRAGKALAGSLAFVGARGPTRIGKALSATLGSSGVLARVSSAVQAVFGWGARGKVGGAAAADPFQRLGSESARDPWQRIGSESADDPFKRIGAESADADTGAIGGESAQGTTGKIGSDEA